MKMNRMLLSALAAFAAMTLGGQTMADTITVENPGFEYPGTGKISTGFDVETTDVDNWDNVSGYYLDSGIEDNWSTDGDSYCAYFGTGDAGAQQDTTVVLAEDDVCSMTFDTYFNWQGAQVTAYFIGVDGSDNETELTSLAVDMVTGTEYLNNALVYTATASDAGLTLRVRFAGTGSSSTSSNGYPEVDNVVLTVNGGSDVILNGSFSSNAATTTTGFDADGRDVPGWEGTATDSYGDSGVETAHPASGSYNAYLQGTDGPLFQDTDHVIAADEKFTLTGTYGNSWQGSSLCVYLKTSDDDVLSSATVDVSSGTVAAHTLDAYVFAGDPAIGKTLRIFYDNEDSTSGTFVNLDDISLEVGVVPVEMSGFEIQ